MTMILRKITRPLLASAFVASGVEALRTPAAQTRTAQPLVDGARNVLPEPAAAVVPTDAAPVVKINGAVQIGAGILLATGKAPRIASGVLAGTLAPTTMVQAAFWAEPDPQLRALKRDVFIKNVGLLGGVLLAAADTEGKPSLAWRGRRRAEAAKAGIAAALPFGAAASNSALQQLADRAQHDAQEAGERASVVADAARERAGELAETVADRAPVLAEQARDRAADWAETVADRAPVIAEQARDRASAWAGTVAQRAPEIADTVRTDAREAGRRARRDAKKARARLEKLER